MPLFANPELTAPVDLCLPDGRLNPAARGHSRRPLHRPNLSGWGRAKRWEYWGLVTPTHVLGLTLANLDVLSLQECFVLDRKTRQERSLPFAAPLGLGVRLPDTLPDTPYLHFGLGVAWSSAAQGALTLYFDEVGVSRTPIPCD